MKQVGRCMTFLMFVISPVPAYAASAHVHGVASLQVAIDGDRLVLDFSSPLDNLVGFEHAPRNDKQKAAVRRMAERLHKAELMFVPTAEARCARSSVNLVSPVLDRALLSVDSVAKPASPEASGGEARKGAGKPDKSGHAALSAEIVFRCERPGSLSGLEVDVFDAFPDLKRLDVQVAGAKRQTGAKLSPRNRRVSW